MKKGGGGSRGDTTFVLYKCLDSQSRLYDLGGGCVVGWGFRKAFVLLMGRVFGWDRDLKLDNTLLSGDDPPIVKLCDFGFAKDWETVADMHTHIG